MINWKSFRSKCIIMQKCVRKKRTREKGEKRKKGKKTRDQITQICQQIIKDYPFLQDKGIGSGYDSWYSQIYEKFRNERKHAQDPLVLQRKRKSVDSDTKVVKKSLRRGGINWEPPYPEGEDEASIKAHVAFMKNESRKRSPNLEKIQSRMDRTFPHRRRFINEKRPLAEIRHEYPTLFTSKEIVSEFERILAVKSSITEQFKANFSQMANKVLLLAKMSKKAKCYEQVKKYLKLLENDDSCDQEVENSDDEISDVALLLAALLLQKSGKNDLSSFIQFIPEGSNFEKVASEMDEVHPKILVKGELQDLGEKAVVAEKTVICTVQGMLLDAVVVYMAVNYSFMFEYPVGFNQFCLFVQKCVLSILDGKKLPGSVLDFVNKLDTL
ncbi:uncharacterized protein LOC114541360 [Dendronephthya gigantea]|uniref:uncharacterized protein LOC114541360 n=1 Tax=Dendronephthya gigantea TaxID=151771 RepID=UPI00106B6405|nr:uncharacterized protein LOC114541360 [Dendronephthya gigantea]